LLTINTNNPTPVIAQIQLTVVMPLEAIKNEGRMVDNII
jgi:hypothetical protein